MKDDIASPMLTQMPKEYDPIAVDRALRTLEIHLNNLASVGPIRVSAININNIPTSSAGLRSGDIWSDAGTLKIIP